VDWTYTTLNTTGSWWELDLSAIIDAGTKVVHFALTLKVGSVGIYVQFRKNGNVRAINIYQQRTQVANLFLHCDFLVACDTDLKVEYRFQNTFFTNLDLTVRGWFV